MHMRSCSTTVSQERPTVVLQNPVENSCSDALSFQPAGDARRTRGIGKPPEVGTRIIWEYLFFLVLFHACIPLAFVPWLFSWTGLVLLPIGHFVFDWIGIGLCFHRTLTHRGLVLPKWLEHTFAIFGVCTLMDSPARWVAIHRKHHQHTDDEPDPHSPLVNLWWGHMGWLIHRNESLSDIDFYYRYAPDILRDPFYLRLERNALWAYVYLAHAVPYFVAGFIGGGLWYGTWLGGLQFGLSLLLWGVVVRTLFSWHATCAVNSVAHVWGYRSYDTRDNSRNNWLVALLTGGEGWHNNHHAQPVSASQGFEWWEFDPTFWLIRLLAAAGLASDIRTFTPSPVKDKNLGDLA